MTLAQASMKIRLSEIPWLRQNIAAGCAATSSVPVAVVVVNRLSQENNININIKKRKRSALQNLPEITLKIAENDPTNLNKKITRHLSSRTKMNYLSYELFNRFYFWIFEQFINPLITSSFYVTEAEGHGSEVHYYRKGVWNKILKKAKSQIGYHFMKVSADQSPMVSRMVINYSDNVNGKNNSKCSDKGSDKSSDTSIGNNRVIHTLPTSASKSTTNKTSPKPSKNATHTAHNITLNMQKAPAVRFVPKKSSVRPITNLKSRVRAPAGTRIKGPRSAALFYIICYGKYEKKIDYWCFYYFGLAVHHPTLPSTSLIVCLSTTASTLTLTP